MFFKTFARKKTDGLDYDKVKDLHRAIVNAREQYKIALRNARNELNAKAELKAENERLRAALSRIRDIGALAPGLKSFPEIIAQIINEALGE